MHSQNLLHSDRLRDENIWLVKNFWSCVLMLLRKWSNFLKLTIQIFMRYFNSWQINMKLLIEKVSKSKIEWSNTIKDYNLQICLLLNIKGTPTSGSHDVYFRFSWSPLPVLMMSTSDAHYHHFWFSWFSLPVLMMSTSGSYNHHFRFSCYPLPVWTTVHSKFSDTSKGQKIENLMTMNLFLLMFIFKILILGKLQIIKQSAVVLLQHILRDSRAQMDFGNIWKLLLMNKYPKKVNQ